MLVRLFRSSYDYNVDSLWITNTQKTINAIRDNIKKSIVGAIIIPYLFGRTKIKS